VTDDGAKQLEKGDKEKEEKTGVTRNRARRGGGEKAEAGGRHRQ
jgi:hypothetical protein